MSIFIKDPTKENIIPRRYKTMSFDPVTASFWGNYLSLKIKEQGAYEALLDLYSKIRKIEEDWSEKKVTIGMKGNLESGEIIFLEELLGTKTWFQNMVRHETKPWEYTISFTEVRFPKMNLCLPKDLFKS